MRRKILSKSKQASLSLSMNAIVVVVLAFAMLGLGLTLTSQIFGGIPKLEPPALDGGVDPNNPLNMQTKFSMKRLSEVELGLKYYNAQGSTAYDAAVKVTECISSDKSITPAGNGIIDNVTELPDVTSSRQDIGPSEIAEYKVLFSLKDKTLFTSGNTYICTLGIVDGNTGTCDAVEEGTNCKDDNGEYYTQEFFLTVVS